MSIYPWGDHRPYNSYSRYFRERFGSRVQKVTIDAGFTCPNRDGTLGTGGCHFCNNDGFNPSYCDPEKPVTQQIDEGIAFHQWRYKRAISYLAYFQAYSNTYGETEHIIAKYEEALNHPEVIGLVIGTRPDCVGEDLLKYLHEKSRLKYIHLEFGIESVYDETLKNINRGHDFETARIALHRVTDLGITTGAHFIFGLPGESREMMLNSAEIISALPLTTVKFHQLQILKKTRFEEMHHENPNHFDLFGYEEYIRFITQFLGKLNPEFVVERFAGEVPPRFQAVPGWGLIRNESIVAAVEANLLCNNTWQGKHFQPVKD
jgi:radical SAM protein (TIGR01212 family)